MSLKETFVYEDIKMYMEMNYYIFIIYILTYPRDVLLSFDLENSMSKKFATPKFLGFKSAFSYSLQVSVILKKSPC